MKRGVLLAFSSIILFPFVHFAQTPAKQNLAEYRIPDGKDTIRFYVFNPNKLASPKLFLYLQGSGQLPLVNGDDENECCYNNYPKKLMQAFPKDYAFVYIQKLGLPYYVRNIKDFKPDSSFFRRNNVADRASVADKVVNY